MALASAARLVILSKLSGDRLKCFVPFLLTETRALRVTLISARPDRAQSESPSRTGESKCRPTIRNLIERKVIERKVLARRHL
ncbi:hypothetical protein OE88DRAFT_806107 [Heliocybe sulcata]|uniref:Uncharacterized protein n=1 Tax=Heliocybe sulcata TaxID=5364 RepID=A0A5C3MQ86_9AGAM|nr:hypothetical protein OE88DRAFT_806107 [Heliocybe sulcata]